VSGPSGAFCRVIAYDLDIWRAAQLMVKRYGEDAAIQAGMRADDLLAEGDVDGAATWRAIIRAIEELQRV
jgi:triphosphoribosyl-dephospho-CoA synthetase